MVGPCKQNASGEYFPKQRGEDQLDDLWTNYIEVHLKEMMDVVEDREVWRHNLELLPPRLS